MPNSIGLDPIIAKNDFENTTVLCQVCRLIMSSKFGVYILNKCMTDDQNRHLPNPNVTLELGLAMGNRKKMIMIVERGTQIIADLAGYIRIEYDVADNIPALINSHNFTSFYTEGD
jgi:predicted nucleotide-binding protein